jgi:hypothetical protein
MRIDFVHLGRSKRRASDKSLRWPRGFMHGMRSGNLRVEIAPHLRRHYENVGLCSTSYVVTAMASTGR